MLLTKLIREDKPKLDKKMASVSNWATAAYGLANHCEDVVLWLRKHHAWSPRQEIAARVEDRALQKEPYPALPCPTLPCPALPYPAQEVQRSAELGEKLCVVQGRWLKAAENASDLRAENGALTRRCSQAESEAKDQQAA